MEILQNYNLTKLNTFGVCVNAKFFTITESEADLQALFTTSEFKENKKIFIGGGSNILFTKDFDGIVVLNKIKGIEIIKDGENEVWVRSAGGEVWHDLVEFAVDRGYWGIENLSLVPGTVGAAPMQNIGAYGAELKNVLENVECFEIETGEKKIFNVSECALGYRDSVFKNIYKDKYFITGVTLKLSKKENKNIEYKVLKNYLEENNIKINGPKDVSDAVSAIRRSKLPDPKLIGNAGSFFKNIFVNQEKLEELKAIHPQMPYFVEEDESPAQSLALGWAKIPAGWLIEQCGWKGKRVGNVGVHDKQALVLVNHGGATGEEVLNLANQIIQDVREKFGLELVPEVNVI